MAGVDNLLAVNKLTAWGSDVPNPGACEGLGGLATSQGSDPRTVLAAHVVVSVCVEQFVCVTFLVGGASG